MADINYLKQPQGDADAAEALKHVVIHNLTIDVSVSTLAGPFYPGNARSIQILATGTCKPQIRGNGGSGLAASAFRNLLMTSEVQNASATGAGHINGDAMPHEFYLLDASGVDNAITMYFNY